MRIDFVVAGGHKLSEAVEQLLDRGALGIAGGSVGAACAGSATATLPPLYFGLAFTLKRESARTVVAWRRPSWVISTVVNSV